MLVGITSATAHSLAASKEAAISGFTEATAANIGCFLDTGCLIAHTQIV